MLSDEQAGELYLSLSEPVVLDYADMAGSVIEKPLCEILRAAGEEVELRVITCMSIRMMRGQPVNPWRAIFVTGCAHEVQGVIQRKDPWAGTVGLDALYERLRHIQTKVRATLENAAAA